MKEMKLPRIIMQYKAIKRYHFVFVFRTKDYLRKSLRPDRSVIINFRKSHTNLPSLSSSHN